MIQRREQLKKIRKQDTYGYYERLSHAREEGVPVVHCSAMGPGEIFYAMGILPYFPENYVTICAAKQQAGRFCEIAEKLGYSMDLCSYARAGIGMMMEEDGPLGPMPVPNVIVGNTLGCDPYTKWWEIEARHYGVPLYIFDGPYNYSGKLHDYQVRYMARDLEKMVEFLEEHTGRRFEMDKLKEAIAYLDETHRLFQEVLDLRANVPCPIGLREMAGELYYLVVRAGTREARDYYTLLRDEVRGRVESGQGILFDEKFRLIYENIPLWYNLQLFDSLAEKGAVIAADSYTMMDWQNLYFAGLRMDPEQPFESVAKKILFWWSNIGLETRIAQYLKVCRSHHIDGAILFSNRSCKMYSFGLHDMGRVMEENGIPTMTFEAEMADPRSFNRVQVETRIDAFLEVLAQHKAEPL
ncbi:2-hydroxyacyl-CoA dehydratase subunit D [Thermodesulfobacteriota bacterium]